MSTYIQHNDSSIFPNPGSFDPSRWLSHASNSPEHTKLDKYLVSFGKGAHGCIGATFAWAQLYLTLASVHRKFDLELEPISDWDMEFEDRFVGLHHVGAKRVHVRVSP